MRPLVRLLAKRLMSMNPSIASNFGLRYFASLRYSSNLSCFGRSSKITANIAGSPLSHQAEQKRDARKGNRSTAYLSNALRVTVCGQVHRESQPNTDDMQHRSC